MDEEKDDEEERGTKHTKHDKEAQVKEDVPQTLAPGGRKRQKFSKEEERKMFLLLSEEIASGKTPALSVWEQFVRRHQDAKRRPGQSPQHNQG